MFNFLKGTNLLSSKGVYYSEFNHVGGLAPSAPVLINGLNVGKVENIEFIEGENGKLSVAFSVGKAYQFSKNSTVELFDNGFLGGKALQIIPTYDNAAKAVYGDVLQSKIKGGLTTIIGEQLSPIQQKLNSVLSTTNSSLSNINSILDEQTKNDLKQAISGLSVTLNSFKSTSQTLNALIKANEAKLNSTLNNFEKTTTNFTKISNDLAKQNIGETVKKLNTTLNNFDKIIASIEKGEGSIGKLLKDDSMYTNLQGASLQLEQLLEDMKLNPKRYVHFSLFGKKVKQYDANGNEVKKSKN